MARRGFTVIFTLLGVACFISVAALVALYLFLGRQPSVPSNATLVLRVGGNLAEPRCRAAVVARRPSGCQLVGILR